MPDSAATFVCHAIIGPLYVGSVAASLRFRFFWLPVLLLRCLLGNAAFKAATCSGVPLIGIKSASLKLLPQVAHEASVICRITSCQ